MLFVLKHDGCALRMSTVLLKSMIATNCVTNEWPGLSCFKYCIGINTSVFYRQIANPHVMLDSGVMHSES
jgi:hypothetical protein